MEDHEGAEFAMIGERRELYELFSSNFLKFGREPVLIKLLIISKSAPSIQSRKNLFLIFFNFFVIKSSTLIQRLPNKDTFRIKFLWFLFL